MAEKYFVSARGVLGLCTNVDKFKWSYGITVPETTREEYEACDVRIRLFIGDIASISQESASDNGRNLGKYHYFSGISGADMLRYQRPFLLNAQLQIEARGLLSDEPCLSANRTYYRFITHRFMNLHSIGYILTDLASLLLLRRGYAPLHCSAFKKGDSTVVVFAPPNTGKTLSTMMACMEYGAMFLAEDLAITDGERVFSVPWTSTFRYYSQVDESRLSRMLNALTRVIPPIELFRIRKPRPVDAYIDSEQMIESSEITHLAILERGTTSVKQETPDEALRKITNLNRYEFKYDTAPLIVAHEFFNPSLNIDAARRTEQDILKTVVKNANERLVVRTGDVTEYASLILDAVM